MREVNGRGKWAKLIIYTYKILKIKPKKLILRKTHYKIYNDKKL